MSDSLQTDWDWLLKVMKMTEDRVLDGERIQLRRAVWLPKDADVKELMLLGLTRKLKAILSTAEIIEPEKAHAPQS